MICRTAAEIELAKKGTAGSLFIPKEAGEIGFMGDVIEVLGQDPEYPHLLRKWKGSITGIDSEGVTIEGRFWIGSKEALDSLGG